VLLARITATIEAGARELTLNDAGVGNFCRG